MAIQPSPPAELQANPYMPPGPPPLVMEQFAGINTATLRPGVPEEQCCWIDGFMPLAPRNLRTLYGFGTSIYTPAGKTILFFGFYNIGSTPYCVVFLSDGSVVQVNTLTLAVTTILAAGTIMFPSVTNTGFCQYGSNYLIIVNTQTSGYWVWDGSVLYAAGTLTPTVTLTNAGTGYTSSPTVNISGGSGGGASIIASIANGVVTTLTVTNAGSGWVAGDTVTLTFSGGQSTGSGADLTAVLTNAAGGSGSVLTPVLSSISGGYTVSSVTVTNGGSGYSQFTTVGYSGGNVTRPPVFVPFITGGVITSVMVVDGGALLVSSPFSVNASDPGGFFVSSVTINNGGSGYSASASVAASGGGSPVSQAVLTLVITGGVVTNVIVQNGGQYGSNTPPTVTVTDNAVLATATAELMPFAIQGNSVETYSGHVWVADGDIVYFSAPGSFSDFGGTNGGGNFTSSDSFLQIQYTRLINTNGFLWLVGDSSLSYISGVQTGGSPTATTYTLQNADPEVGTPWPYSVNTWNRNIIFANSWGVQIGYGSAVTKTSEMLDGIYDSVLTPTSTWQTSSAKATIYNRKVFMILIPIIDPVSKLQVNKLMMWDGKRWWATQQNQTLIFIATQEINSVLSAYGTTGSNIYKMFTTPTTTITKTVQSRLWDVGGYWLANATNRFWAMFQYYDVNYTTVDVLVDNELGSTSSQTVDISISQTVSWVNSASAAVTWLNSSAAVVTWYAMSTGITIVQPTAVAQQGVLAGFTIQTTDMDMAIISAALKPEIVQYRG